MRILTRYIFVLFLAFASLSVAAQEVLQDPETPSGPWPEYYKPEVTDATSLKLIELHLQARGGKNALSSVNSLQMEGVLLEGRVDSRMITSALSTGSLHRKTVRFFRGDYYTIAYGTGDGDSWSQKQTPEKELPRKLGGLDERLLQLDGLLPWLLVDSSTAGHLFSYQKQETFAGKPVYVIHGWLSNGMQIDILFDAKSFHIVNYRHLFRIGGKEVLVDRMPLGLWRSNDAWWEKGYSFRVRGKIFRKVTYEAVTSNVSFEQDMFRMPPVNERWIRITPEG